jgi:acyl-[acyl-carrier-protein]-phospholipid O-acyltransferase/long-chain-fatty-acid--[acyl-carrier-protein] ligase
MWGHRLSCRPGGRWSRREVIIVIGEPVRERITPAQMREKVLELGNRAAMLRAGRNTLPQRLVAVARRNWSRRAVADSTGRDLTFGRLLAGAALVRRWLERQRPDEAVIGILLPSTVAGAVVNIGVTLAGRTVANLNFTTGEQSMAAAIGRCGLATIITSRAFLAKLKLAETPQMVFVEDLMQMGRMEKLRALLTARLAPARVVAGKARPQDTAAIIFSSGSTGDPKGVMLTHANLLANIDSVSQLFDMGTADCMLGALPFFHSFGFTYTLWFPLLQGACSVFHPNPMDGKIIGDMAARYQATFFISTPTFCLNYLRHCTRQQFASLRYLLVGAEKMRPKLAEAFTEKFGITPLEGYGCTEMGPVVAVNRPDVVSARPHQLANCQGSVGRPIPGVVARIVHPETMAELPLGETGLLLVTGPSRMTGYVGDPEKTAAALREGFYNTGDIARLDEDGFLHIVDRLARMSKIGGEMVPHLKVEEALAAAVHHTPCIVVGVPDEQRGERLVALYTAQDVTPAQLYERLAADGLPPLWIPKRENFYQVDAIPALGTGKADLREARRIAQERAAECVRQR